MPFFISLNSFSSSIKLVRFKQKPNLIPLQRHSLTSKYFLLTKQNPQIFKINNGEVQYHKEAESSLRGFPFDKSKKEYIVDLYSTKYIIFNHKKMMAYKLADGLITDGAEHRGILIDENSKIGKIAWTRHRTPIWFFKDNEEIPKLLKNKNNENLVLYKHTPVEIINYKTFQDTLFAQIKIHSWVRVSDLNISNFTEKPSKVSETEKWMAINIEQQTLVAYEGSRAVMSTKISSGLLDKFPTKKGLFRIYREHQVRTMAGGRGEDRYNLKEIPYALYFYKGQAMHGTYWHNSFGKPTSHGCINLSLSDAEWLYKWALNIDNVKSQTSSKERLAQLNKTWIKIY